MALLLRQMMDGFMLALRFMAGVVGSVEREGPQGG
jgi:hypothetical protein